MEYIQIKDIEVQILHGNIFFQKINLNEKAGHMK